ncbi:prolactin-inducible protein [Sciurus carolinensis]|uniref:prolactin-inducible protein n=1 Tax=Sciurus carolinensis TaxID=30640 RepID=UPI001FB39E2E|nr:prolactin-inducible protein [Sciurus carolinensis]
MRSLQLPLRVGLTALLLVLCLQLGLSRAQENTTKRRVIDFDLNMPQTAKANEEVTVQLRLQTELRECMVVKAHLQSNLPIEGAFNYKYTRCLCEDNPLTFLWDFQSNKTAKIAVVVDIIKEANICVQDISVVPNEANRYYTLRTLVIE